MKTSSFLEELFNSTMNALHLVGNSAFLGILDIHSDAIVKGMEVPFRAFTNNGNGKAAVTLEADRRSCQEKQRPAYFQHLPFIPSTFSRLK